MEELNWDNNTNYYEILNININCTLEEIKKSYRKQALKWHPDRNPNNIEQSTNYFQLIEKAYSTLSDPNKKIEYDNLIKIEDFNSILNKKIQNYDLNDDDIYDGFSNSKKGFYNIYEKKFEKIAKEENLINYPKFGNSESKWEDIQKFYDFWLTFQTKKDFFEVQKNLLERAPNSKIKHEWIKENEKFKKKAILDYNNKIHELTLNIKKKDPRISAFIELQEKEKEQQKEIQKKLNFLKNQKLLKELENYENEKKLNLEKIIKEEEEEEDINEFYWSCEYCGRKMKDEKTFKTHCLTKKHIKKTLNFKNQFLNDLNLLEISNYNYLLLGITKDDINKFNLPNFDFNIINNPKIINKRKKIEKTEDIKLIEEEEEEEIIEKNIKKKWKDLSKKERRKIKFKKNFDKIDNKIIKNNNLIENKIENENLFKNNLFESLNIEIEEEEENKIENIIEKVVEEEIKEIQINKTINISEKKIIQKKNINSFYYLIIIIFFLIFILFFRI